MEEADALATRAAIISGRLLALGTTSVLRKKYGDIYHVHLVLKSAPASTRAEMERVQQWAERTFNGVRFDMYSSFHGQVKFSVPASTTMVKKREPVQEAEIKIDEGSGSQPPARNSSVGALFSYLEASKDEIGLKFYSVGATTLDNVFLNVVREHNVKEEGYTAAASDEKRRRLICF